MWIVRLLVLSIVSMVLLSASKVRAEPTTPSAYYIAMIRPYINGEVFLHLKERAAGIDCPTEVFKIRAGQNAMAAVALSAFLTGKPIKLELADDTKCTGWGSALQSLYICSNASCS